MKPDPKVIIVGAGFGGLQTALSLAGKGVEVLLIDRQRGDWTMRSECFSASCFSSRVPHRHNYHTFVPLLYRVVTAQLVPEQVAVPIRTLLRKATNLNFLQIATLQPLFTI